MPQDSLTITDNRTGQNYTLPIEHGAIRAMDLRKIKTDSEDFGLMTYDPAFMNTASCKSAITYIDGDKGILRYRGYPIDELAERSTYLEVAYLLLFGELPTANELKSWVHDITHHTMLHETSKKFMEGFRDNAHPMAMLVSTVAALSTVYPDAKNIHDPAVRLLQIQRLIGKMPSIAAISYRHISGLPYIYPDNDLTYTENFMNMLWKMVEPKYVANPVLREALDILVYSACGSRAELQHQCDARRGQFASRSLSCDGFGRRCAFGPAARRSQRRSAAHARRDRHQGPRPGVHQKNQRGQRQTDGLWASRL